MQRQLGSKSKIHRQQQHDEEAPAQPTPSILLSTSNTTGTGAASRPPRRVTNAGAAMTGASGGQATAAAPSRGGSSHSHSHSHSHNSHSHSSHSHSHLHGQGHGGGLAVSAQSRSVSGGSGMSGMSMTSNSHHSAVSAVSAVSGAGYESGYSNNVDPHAGHVHTSPSHMRAHLAMATSLDPLALRYWQTQLESFNLLSVVTNPREHDLWETIWNSEILGGEGELEEYDPTNTSDMSMNPLWAELERYYESAVDIAGGGGGGAGGGAAQGAHSSTQTQAHSGTMSLSTGGDHATPHSHAASAVDHSVDMTDFARFLGRTGSLARTFVVGGEQLQAERLQEPQTGDDTDTNESDREEDGSSCDDGDGDSDSDSDSDHSTSSQDGDGADGGGIDESERCGRAKDDEVEVSQEQKERIADDADGVGKDEGDGEGSKDEAVERRQHTNGEVASSASDKRGTRTKDRRRKKSSKKMETPQERKTFALLEQCEALVPEIFFSQYFDLTDPRTFETLIGLLDEGVTASMGSVGALSGPSIADKGNDAQQPGSNIGAASPTGGVDGAKEDAECENDGATPKPKQERQQGLTHDEVYQRKAAEHQEQLAILTQHLDSVEVALLEQVRSKSQMYFTETNRFAELKILVHDSIQDVNSLRSSLTRVKQQAVTDVEDIPKQALTREGLEQLQVVLDLISDVVTAKASVGGLIAANDFRGSIEAMLGARVLLGTSTSTSTGMERDHGNESGVDGRGQSAYCLGKLRCLSNINTQLGEYEKLVVDNLSNALVDTFLSWDTLVSDRATSSASFVVGSAIMSPSSHQSNVRELVQALSLCNKLTYANNLHISRLCDLVKVTIKTTVTECAADTQLSLGLKSSGGGDVAPNANGSSGIGGNMFSGVGGMSFEQFISCLDMLFEQLLTLLKSAVGVNKFLREEGIVLKDAHSDDQRLANGTKAATNDSKKRENTSGGSVTALAAASELAHKSVSELLRLRKDAHSLVSFEEMKTLWDTCLAFTLQLEKCSGSKAYGLRSTLLAQAKAFVERKHESHMAALVAALDSEKWHQCDVSTERQAALTRLCSGRAVLSTKSSMTTQVATNQQDKDKKISLKQKSGSGARRELAEAEIEGSKYKVVWSCLLLVEMVMADVSCAAHFQTLATNMVGKICELLRLFNTRTTQLVLGAGAIHSSARLKSINAKHLALVTQCLGLVTAILPHVRAALMAQLPSKQHLLLVDLDRIKKDYADHTEKVLSKFVSIVGGIIEHGLAPRISKIDFDQRAAKFPPSPVDGSGTIPNGGCCPFFEGITTNTKKMHQVLSTLLPPDHLGDVFSRIFVYVDQKVPSLLVAAAESSSTSASPAGASASSPQPTFSMPTTEQGKQRMILEVKSMSESLNQLNGVSPWSFSMASVLEKELGMSLSLEGKEEGGEENGEDGEDKGPTVVEGESSEEKQVTESLAETKEYKQMSVTATEGVTSNSETQNSGDNEMPISAVDHDVQNSTEEEGCDDHRDGSAATDNSSAEDEASGAIKQNGTCSTGDARPPGAADSCDPPSE